MGVIFRDTKGLPYLAMDEGQHKPDRRYADGPVVGLTGARFGGTAGRRLRQVEPGPAPDLTPAPAPDSASGLNQADEADRPVVGQVGARFPSAAARRLLTESDPRHEPDPRPVAGAGSDDGADGADGAVPGPVEAAAVDGPVDRAEADSAEWAVDETDWGLPEPTYGLVRPYSWTGGRTTPCHEMAMETLISASGPPGGRVVSPEHHAVLGLCATPRSVAEVAALLSVPLGVVRVILGDMAEAGSVVVHPRSGRADGTPDLALMQRVLHCLQRL